jgi:hypothetical protein
MIAAGDVVHVVNRKISEGNTGNAAQSKTARSAVIFGLPIDIQILNKNRTASSENLVGDTTAGLKA